VNIKNARKHKYATSWVLGCVVVHNIGLEVEQEERNENEDIEQDEFFPRHVLEHEDNNDALRAMGEGDGGKEKRRYLREALFCAHGIDPTQM
jgi:hypothetical protein